MLDYYVVDVFTGRAFHGNPLAVVLGADQLSAEQMQAIAAEFHLSETAFPLPVLPTSEGPRRADYALRIFTPEVELPFAGHPSIGTAWVLARLGRLSPGDVVQRCAAGDFALRVSADGPEGPGPVELTGIPPTVGRPLPAERLLAAVGLSVGNLAGPPPRQAGTGLAWTFLTVDGSAVGRAVAEVATLRAVAELAPAGIYLHSVDEHAPGVAGAQAPGVLGVHARGFAGDLGVVEDPATGSAALGLGAYLVASGLVAAEGTSAYAVRQGVEMGRPSTLRGVVKAVDGRAVQCRVTGDVVPVAEGRIRIP